MRITTYGHAILISVLGIYTAQYNGILWGFVGGTLIGFGLVLARQSGKEDKL